MTSAPRPQHRPPLEHDRLARARESALWTSGLATVVVPLWSGFDLVLEPHIAPDLVTVRLACLLPMLLAVWALWRSPIGRRQPEPLTCVVLVTVQSEIAWMVPRVEHVEFHLLGFTLSLLASGCLVVARPVWTGTLVVATWAASGIAVLTAPTAMPVHHLLASAFSLATASVLGVVARSQRHRLTSLESAARTALELEQERTRALLARLERLSHEDPLTGPADRRRWTPSRWRPAPRPGRPGRRWPSSHRRRPLHGGRRPARPRRWGRGTAADRRRAHPPRPDGDVVARLGGDELAVLLPGTDLGRAVTLAEELRAAALELDPSGGGPGSLTLSLDVAVASGRGRGARAAHRRGRRAPLPRQGHPQRRLRRSVDGGARRGCVADHPPDGGRAG